MEYLNIASWGLAVGGMGQALFFAYLFPNNPGKSVFNLTYAGLLIPWLAVFVISFCNRAPVGPSMFRRILIFTMCWYTTATLLAETLRVRLHPVPHGNYPLWVPRILMYPGALSFIAFVRVCITLRRLDASKTHGY
jgi:hypothetical protein